MSVPSEPVYAELHCKTNFSFLCGASHPEELAARAAELGYRALAITDRNTLAGVVRAHAAAKNAGMKLLVGAEIVPQDAPPVLLLAPDHAAYRNLSSLITRGRRAAEKGECSLFLEDVADYSGALLAAVIPSEARIGRRTHSPSPPSTGERGAEVQRLREEDNIPVTLVQEEVGLARYREIFGDRCFLAASLHCSANDEVRLQKLACLAKQATLPLVATNDVHYHDPSRRALQEVLLAIQHGVTVAELGALRFPNGERYLKSPSQMAELFAAHPEALERAVEIAERCSFSLDELRYEYPEELCPAGLTPTQYLAGITWAGARERYPDGVPDKVKTLLERELALIEELRYEAFFLTCWDLVKFARGHGILCQGRGSAANSAVCFCLGITSVDPGRTDVLFERFISRERNEAPDIDIDFEHERREEVLQYVYKKYGRDRAGIVAEVITYRPRSAVRDVGKALGLSLDAVDRLAKTFDPYSDAAAIAAQMHEAGLDPKAPGVVQFTRLATELLGFPRHLSQHVGGFVITGGPLSELVPIENAAMPDRTFIEWDKDDLDTLGILKVDCLSLGMLTAIRKCFDLIAQHHGRLLTLATVPAEDPAVYDMICKADTIGVFQIESRAQMSMLPRLLPRRFYDLVIEVALVRPGPIQGGMVHPYLRRRAGEEPVTYPSPLVKEVLEKTLGVPLFQEQVMRLAVVAAGFTPGEADQLRRAMGAWRRQGVIERFRGKLRDGMLARGLPAQFADQLYEQIRGFGEYGFPEAHAASFALLAYISAWLKCHYPAAFAAALLNSQPMGFYAPAQIVRDAREHGVGVRPIDVNSSAWDCTLEVGQESGVRNQESGVRNQESGAREEENMPSPRASLRALGVGADEKGKEVLRLGLRVIRGLSEAVGPAMVAARAEAPFRSIADLARRTQLGRTVLARLAAADAFGSLGLNRRTALWNVLSLGEELPLFAALDDDPEPMPALADLSLDQQVFADYGATGLSLKAHPISLVREELNQLKVTPASSLTERPDKSVVVVAGLVLVRQQPGTSKGTIFMTLEDETGTINLVVWPRVWDQYRKIIRGASAVLVQGKIERASRVLHVIASTVEDLSRSLRGLQTRSRDFH